jgi:hypothetical protein
VRVLGKRVKITIGTNRVTGELVKEENGFYVVKLSDGSQVIVDKIEEVN